MNYYLLSLTVFALAAARVQAHSEAFQPPFVGSIVERYLEVHEALVRGDLPAAQTASGSYLEAMKAAPGGEAAEEVDELKTPAERLVSAPDLESAREAFADLSGSVKLLIKHVGTDGEQSLFTFHCPMAFDGKGAEWIQAGEAVANPYFGQQMSGCGSIEEQIAGPKGMAAHHEDQRDRDAHLHLH